MPFIWSSVTSNIAVTNYAIVAGALAVQAALPTSVPSLGTTFAGSVCSSWDYCFASYYLFSHAIYLAFTLLPPIYALSKQLAIPQTNSARYANAFTGVCVLLLVYVVEALSSPVACWQTNYFMSELRDIQPLYSVSHIFLILTPYVTWLWIFWAGYSARLLPASFAAQWLAFFIGLPVLSILVIAMFLGGLWSLYNDFALLVWNWDYIELFALDNVWWYSLLAHIVLRGHSPLLLIGVALLVLRLFRMSFLESTHHLTGAGSVSSVDTLVTSLGGGCNSLLYCFSNYSILFFAACACTLVLTLTVKPGFAFGVKVTRAMPRHSTATGAFLLLIYQTVFFLYVILRVLATMPILPEWLAVGGFVFTTYLGYFWFISAVTVLFALIYPRLLALVLLALTILIAWVVWPLGALITGCCLSFLLNEPARLLLSRAWPHICAIVLFLCFVSLAAHTYLISPRMLAVLVEPTSCRLTNPIMFTHGSITGLPGWPLWERSFCSLLASGGVWGSLSLTGSQWLFSFPAGAMGVFILALKYYFARGVGQATYTAYRIPRPLSCLYAFICVAVADYTLEHDFDLIYLSATAFR